MAYVNLNQCRAFSSTGRQCKRLAGHDDKHYYYKYRLNRSGYYSLQKVYFTKTMVTGV